MTNSGYSIIFAFDQVKNRYISFTVSHEGYVTYQKCQNCQHLVIHQKKNDTAMEEFPLI